MDPICDCYRVGAAANMCFVIVLHVAPAKEQDMQKDAASSPALLDADTPQHRPRAGFRN